MKSSETNINNKRNFVNAKTAPLSIFNKFIKNNSKLMPFNIKTNYTGETKYFPPFSKEWKNSIYAFNFNSLKNLPLYNININTLIKTYFNLYFNPKFINKFTSLRSKRLSLNKIFVSKAEIKHTNSKAIISIYTYNREKRVLLKKIKNIKILFYKKILSLLYNSDKLYLGKNIMVDTKGLRLKTILALLHKELILFRRFKLKLNLNKYKFEEKFLFKLNKLISNFYNKKVEFNIINMKYIILNSDFFTKILSLKIKNRKAKIIKLMNIILNKVKFPEVNRIREKSRIIKSVNFDLIENKYKNVGGSLNSIMIAPAAFEKIKLDNIFNNLYYNLMLEGSTPSTESKNIQVGNWGQEQSRLKKSANKLYEIIFNSIKYKNMSGIRLEIKGRLTRRYRADRALFKVKWKGGMKNIDSSYKGLSSVNLRGLIKPNVEYSIYTSKRRIGAFAVKGWISGK